LWGLEVWIERSSRAVVSHCKTENQARCARYWSAMKAISGEHGGGVYDEGEVVAVMLGGVNCEIEPQGGFCPAKPKNERRGLGIGLRWK
jgi:hypothetical protein